MEEMLRQNSLSLQKPLALPVTIQPTTATTKRGEMRTYTSERKGERKECSNFRPKNHLPSTLNTLPVGRKTTTVRREEGFRLSAREKEKREMVKLLHSKCPPCHTIRPLCPQTLTLSRFSRHRDSANPHCAIFCYLPSPNEPLQKPFALPMTREPITATTKGGECSARFNLQPPSRSLKCILVPCPILAYPSMLVWFGMSGCRRKTMARTDTIAQASLSHLGEMSKRLAQTFLREGSDQLSFERASVSLRRGESRLSDNA
ncbi:hypothetical protein DEO72_LG3g655 [Vigna unguiculata]|uniref:Uncharacterized protein n=1 Tax=Vigna unguiculata TaxID=3917 RepID=A0A4D6LCX2_VIGUN|nr:hypothetical protein DEO72_LG3g655 [Vigna unguiculata]